MPTEEPTIEQRAAAGAAHTEDLAQPVLSVVVPIFNERDNVDEILRRVLAVPLDVEVVIVDDASTDGTRERLQSMVEGRYANVRVVYHDRNRGKGMAIRTAIPHLRGALAIIQDADLEYDPVDYPAIVAAFDAPEVDAVYGSRFMHGWPPMRLANHIVNRLLAWMVRCLYRVPLTDEATCYKAVRTEVLKRIPLDCERFEFCPEITARLIRGKHRIAEVPIGYHPRTIAQGKKIRWTDGADAIWTLVKYRFVKM